MNVTPRAVVAGAADHVRTGLAAHLARPYGVPHRSAAVPVRRRLPAPVDLVVRPLGPATARGGGHKP
ncbi:hypothetical protein ACH4FX_23640 [Streptomyces sp. NPDC018019]|uniref:hypothetical protein n=1 Tax=Streptomyces sp. NPDC018019 TaxID=3365030 RepID=UPI0037B1060B